MKDGVRWTWGGVKMSSVGGCKGRERGEGAGREKREGKLGERS